MQIVILNGRLTEEQENACIREVSAIHPINLIEKLFLDVREDGVYYRCEMHKFREKRKMSGYCISFPDEWNPAKQAELRDTVPNPMSGTPDLKVGA